MKTIQCFVHGISCEGWFNPDNNSIHIRVTNIDNDKEMLISIVHELIHLATYDKKYSYQEREDIVESYLAKPQFNQDP